LIKYDLSIIYEDLENGILGWIDIMFKRVNT